MKLTLTAFANSQPIVFLSRERIRTFFHEQVKSIFSFFYAFVRTDWSISTSWLLHLGTFQHPLCSTFKRFNIPVAPTWNVSTSPLRHLGVFQLPHCSVLERFNFPIAPSCVCVCVCVCLWGGGGGVGGASVRACSRPYVQQSTLTPSRRKRQVPFIL